MNLTYEQLIKDMIACEQTKGMSVLDHGMMVSRYYGDLVYYLRQNIKLDYEWKLPDWIITNKDFILSKLYNDDSTERYHIYHDCGKPYCKTIDSEGKHHFPDHANVSYQIWNQLYPNDSVVSNLIRSDMDIHCLKSEQIEEFANRPEAITLILTGLSEIHANASMFGGIESTSFKIKWKQIDKRGKQVLSILLRK